MSTLYELRELRDLLDVALDETGGELTPELEAEMNALDVATDEKIERVALYIREQLATAEAIESEAKRLQGRAAAKLNAAKSLKAYLQREMESLGKAKVNGLLCTVALQNNPPSVVGELSPAELERIYSMSSAHPDCLIRYQPESYSLNRKAVLDLYKRGDQIPEGLTIEQTKSLRIR